MIFTYTPAGAEPREWQFRPLDVTSREAELVEDYVGLTFAQWSARFYAGSIKARRAALWLLLRREDPNLGLDDVEFRMTELRCVYDGSEDAELRRQVQDDPELDEVTRARLLAQLSTEDADAAGDEGDAGKGTAPDGAAGSGGLPTS